MGRAVLLTCRGTGNLERLRLRLGGVDDHVHGMFLIPHLHDLLGALAGIGIVVDFAGESAGDIQGCDNALIHPHADTQVALGINDWTMITALCSTLQKTSKCFGKTSKSFAENFYMFLKDF